MPFETERRRQLGTSGRYARPDAGVRTSRLAQLFPCSCVTSCMHCMCSADSRLPYKSQMSFYYVMVINLNAGRGSVEQEAKVNSLTLQIFAIHTCTNQETQVEQSFCEVMHDNSADAFYMYCTCMYDKGHMVET